MRLSWLRQTNNGVNGFTLLELLIVMVIITIGFFALRPTFAGAIMGAQERAAFRQLVGMFKAARSEAVAKGRLIRIVFDPATAVFHAEAQVEPHVDRSNFQPFSLMGRRNFPLPDHLGIGEIAVGGEFLGETDIIRIYFYPDGRTDGVEMVLVDWRGAETIVTITSATGRVRIRA